MIYFLEYTDNNNIFEDNEAVNHHIDHDSNYNAREDTVGNTTPIINHTKNSQKQKLHVPASTEYSED